MNEIFNPGFDSLAGITLEIPILQTRIICESLFLGFPGLDNELFDPEERGLVLDTSRCLQGINSFLDPRTSRPYLAFYDADCLRWCSENPRLEMIP